MFDKIVILTDRKEYMNKKILIELTPDLYEKVQTVAKMEDRSVRNAISRLIKAGLEENSDE